jgi:NADP-dependent 3-hydroxy acid dehydrogenase YdfG
MDFLSDTSQDLMAIVTDASQGVGRAIITELAAVGADIVLCSRRPDKLEAVVNLIRAQGRRELVQPSGLTPHANFRVRV